MDIRGLGYVTVRSSDLAQWRHYASQVLGMMVVEDERGERLFLKMDERPYRILVQRSAQDGFGACGWEVAGQAAFDQAVAELHAAGVVVEQGSAEQAALRQVQALALFADPDGNRHELYWGPRQDFARFVSPVGVRGFVSDGLGMGHVVLPAPTFDRCRDFYEQVMGFGLSDLMKVRFTPDPAEPEKRIHFMHCNNGRHHSLAIFECPVPSGCVHMMVEVAGLEDVGRALDRMHANGVKLSATLGQHTNDQMISFYMKTPSGFDLEYGCDGLVVDWSRHTPFESTVVSQWGHDFSVGRQ
ncbi:Iron-dependent extradiol dioxygenase [Pseudomonas putida]|uniref:Biphenyl 2,3-dioxygenase n=2 Tax=Pseudomonas TaxID=286 RepID=A0AAX0VQT7_9PSED|nr:MULTISPECIES: VOC family protein [Pseudomonas]PLV15824.1 biphenyl 2,3-dioxygenase [Pseudomonas guariconensis]PLV21874.1 biphenyl 2,3-dioxygenase [Pseudomonas guariconensis]PLV26994.1 biphenyl 2,3-dioxygenase [Pseudomonas guariconensis]CAB5550555.1 Iron-dependent extradiol dioxygenase [Pseudomonas putida]CAB5558500.1 Iron-dependent extradiol dioxygenase [Pseudomonas putida]